MTPWAAGRAPRAARLAATLGLAGAVFAWAAAGQSPDRVPPPAARAPVVVASKPFGESYVLAELFAQLLERRGYRVVRRPGLGATELAFAALRAGAVDVYPEYTGTGLLAILGDSSRVDARSAYARVSREFARRYGVRWLPPLGFENTFALTVRRETAERYGLRTIGDLARVAPRLSAAFSTDFAGRADGLPGLARVYGLRFARVRPLVSALKYQALVAGSADVIDAYSTDAAIARFGLVVLADDRQFFPPYEAAALVGARLQGEVPGAVLALTELSGRVDGRMMRELNRRFEVDRVPLARLASDALDTLGIVAGAGARPGAGVAAPAAREGEGGLASYLWRERAAAGRRVVRHLLLVAASLAAAVLFAVPLALWLVRQRTRRAEAVLRAAGVLQTIPGIALLAFMIPLLGIGTAPALVALFLYALYPILRNTYTGARDASPAAVDAARSLGMTERQILRHVRVPLAAPVIMAGVRTAAVINVGTATLAAFIGAGGLGESIVQGLALADSRMVLAGALPAAALAFVVDWLLGRLERLVTPAGR